MSKGIRIGSRRFTLPASRLARVLIGCLLIVGGLLGFLPILGFWMIPLGFLVLSVDLPAVRRWRRRLTVWWHRRKQGGGEDNGSIDPEQRVNR